MQGRRLFGVWCFVVVFLFNSCAGHEAARRTSAALRTHVSPRLVLDAAWAYGTDDGDVLRYLAYARATLGRPYRSYWVRDVEAWRAHFAAGSPGFDDSDDSPLTTPPRALVPYRDFLVEYPPGFFVWALPPAMVTGDGDAYRVLFGMLMALCLTLGLVLVRDLVDDRDRLIAVSLAAVLALGVVVVRRYDAAISLCLCASVWGFERRRPLVGGLAFGVGVASKGVPLLAAPLFVIHYLRAGRGRELGRFVLASVLACLAIALPAVITAGRHLLDVARYHAERPLEVESTWAALAMLWHVVGGAAVAMTHGWGGDNLVGRGASLLARLALPSLLAGAGVVYVTALRRPPDARSLARDVVALMVLYMLTATVFSPQYLVWIVPLGVAVALPRASDRRLLLAVMVLTQLLWPVSAYLGLRDRPAVMALVLARNLVLGVWALRLYWRRKSAEPLVSAGQVCN